FEELYDEYDQPRCRTPDRRTARAAGERHAMAAADVCEVAEEAAEGGAADAAPRPGERQEMPARVGTRQQRCDELALPRRRRQMELGPGLSPGHRGDGRVPRRSGRS